MLYLKVSTLKLKVLETYTKTFFYVIEKIIVMIDFNIKKSITGLKINSDEIKCIKNNSFHSKI